MSASPVANLLGTVSATNALIVSLDGGLASVTSIVFPLGTTLAEDGAGILGQRTSTTAQASRVYNTYTSSVSGEYAGIDWATTANTLLIGSRTLATGNGRQAGLVGQASSGANNYSAVVVNREGPPYISFFPSVNAAFANSTTGASGTFIQASLGTSSTTSGAVNYFAITPTYNQTSGTAANTDLLINRTQTAVGSGAQLLIDAQVSTSSRFNVDTTGAMAIGGANGQVFSNMKSLTELTTIAAAPNTDTTIQMPAASVVLGVSVRVTTVIPTAATFTVGDSGSAARFSTAAVSTAATSTDSGTKAGAYYNASALSIRITPNLQPGDTTGRVRVTIYYYTVTPPTS